MIKATDFKLPTPPVPPTPEARGFTPDAALSVFCLAVGQFDVLCAESTLQISIGFYPGKQDSNSARSVSLWGFDAVARGRLDQAVFFQRMNELHRLLITGELIASGKIAGNAWATAQDVPPENWKLGCVGWASVIPIGLRACDFGKVNGQDLVALRIRRAEAAKALIATTGKALSKLQRQYATAGGAIYAEMLKNGRPLADVVNSWIREGKRCGPSDEAFHKAMQRETVKLGRPRRPARTKTR